MCGEPAKGSLTITPLDHFFALLVFRLFSDGSAKRYRSQKVGISRNGTASNRDYLCECGLGVAQGILD
jgi:hypothetical protein